ncbi:hybrid sensor histidine kinase/response regulator [Butyrivibrio sp. AE3004]|uniref:hybrid sensor histidine kinase/response regulator n=1 Tax=Butyrivibrio sp. AE3004 TaxID=1506994 RepID=UPI00068BD2BB|nr:two-component regulator propeller domain-containing protein [Butyrivibrio sp. AE3004]
MKKKNCKKIRLLAAFIAGIILLSFNHFISLASEEETSFSDSSEYGGGYAATGQITNASFSTELYDATNGLPTSDAMFILGATNGYIWIGSYSGVIRYDGTTFERIDTTDGLTSARAFFEDSKGRIWVGTNDNGVVVLNGDKSKHFTYKDGLTSSSIRVFAEDANGNIFIGTTAGVCYVDSSNTINKLQVKQLSEERVLKLESDKNGKIYGQTANGIVFAIEDCSLAEIYESSDLGIDKITTLMTDPVEVGKVFLGTGGSIVYHGQFGDSAGKMEKISVKPLTDVHWLNYDCGRVWVSSKHMVGYLDEDKNFKVIENIPVDSGIEMLTSDYQGNIWLASSTKGVMKIVTNNFIDYTNVQGFSGEVVNATYLYNDKLYIGTENGLGILDKNGKTVENSLTEYIKGARVRALEEDKDGNLWVATSSKDLGLVCYSPDEEITAYTTDNGMPDNHIRCICAKKDGGLLVGTNEGLVAIKNNRVAPAFTSDNVVKNTVIVSVTETNEGMIIVGTDGFGIYILEGNSLEHLGRDDGLTSDVISRIIKDDEREVIWLVTSNSIECMRSGRVFPITSFPYTDNYDMHFDKNGNAWVLSSYGIFVVDVREMLEDSIKNYKTYTINSGLPYVITKNSFSSLDKNGDLYIPGQNGVIKVNINDFFEEKGTILVDVRSINCDNEKILQDENGIYQIPASNGRIQISVAVMDYTMMNLGVKLFLENYKDEGSIYPRSELMPLEYTNLPYGNYVLHIQILNDVTKEILQDQTFEIRKAPRFSELIILRVIFMTLVTALAGFIVWWVMRSTVIRKQYEEIRIAKEEAENANTAKSRFLANISHEIRTPINTIMGMNEMTMREDPTNVPKGYFMSVMNYAFDIRNATESLLGLINDLLDMSKIESGKMHLVEQEYDTQDMLRSIVSMIRIKSTEKGLTFDVVVDEILPQKLYGDSGKIKQVVLNLLTNAVKYTSMGGISLCVSMDERHGNKAFLRISVKDTGMGVKEEDMEKLFIAYERLDEEKNSAIQGTGLGLDISRRFAELLGGKLWCESVYGEGSEFIFTLNQEITDDAPLGVFIERDETKTGGPYIPKFIAPDADILVVDDNPMNLNVIKGLLKATKVFVSTADSGEEAINKLKDNDYDVVLLDHMMPGLDGIETLAIIREFNKDVPVYALTANSIAGEEFYKEKGFNGFLSKPIDSETLETTIMKHIPENKMEIPTREDAVIDLSEMPEDMLWINDVESISVEDGIKNSGGISSYIFALNLFFETIDENAKIINDSYETGNIRMYTIKVHALKSSARIIGAKKLSELAADLENAGNKQDLQYIDEYTGILLSEYMAYKEKLSLLKGKPLSKDKKGEIPEDMLKDAYEALTDLVPQMDYDGVEMVLDSLEEYDLPSKDAKIIEALGKGLKKFDWEQMEELLNRRIKG